MIHYRADHWWHSSALAKVSKSSILRGRGCCICSRGILTVIILERSGYKMENLLPTGSIIPVGHYITKLPGITGNFRRQLCSYKTSGCVSQGDHSLPGFPFRALHEQPCLLVDTAESPEPTRCCPKSEKPQQPNICARNHIIHVFLSHKAHFLCLFMRMPSAVSQPEAAKACCDWAQQSPGSLAALTWAWNALIALNA